ncbi:hydroxypyruvate reductase isoform X1, partial [Tanacetum coccineum]
LFGAIDKRNMCEDTKAATRILFCGTHFPASNNYTKEYLQNYPSIQVDNLPIDSVPDLIGNYDICVVKSMRLNSDVIARATRMKVIMQYGVGLEGVDVTAATNHGIKVARIPSGLTGNAASCAEMAIYFMLGLLRKQNEMHIAVREKKVGEPIGDTLLGKTVFIMGFGNIGIELSKRLRPFGVKILATKRNWASYDLNLMDSSGEHLVDEKGSHEDRFEFAKKSDIVAGIINKQFISSMRKGGLLVNIARGGLLDYEAVHNGLKSGHLGGLGIDVAWTEPFDPDDPILKFPNVLLTPHVAGVTECSYRSMAKNHGEHLIRRFAGRGNEPDPRDVKIASFKQRIQELEFPQLQQDSPAEEAETESNVWDDGSEDVNPFGGGNPGFHDDHYGNPFFQEEPIVLVEEESCPVYDTDNEEEESMPIYDTDIEDVIEEEEGFVGKGGFCGEEDNIKDVVVVAYAVISVVGDVALQLHSGKPLTGIEYVN